MKTFLTWLTIFAAVAAMRLWRLGTPPLWYDEAGSTWMASLPLDRLIAATAADVHPPLSMLILNPLYALFGSEPMAMRLPSVLASIVSFWALAKLTDYMQLLPMAKVLTLVIMALAPFQMFFAQEARMYALLEMWVMLMTLAMVHRRWLEFALCATAAMYTHNYGIIYWAVVATVLILRELLMDWEIAQVPDAVIAVGAPAMLWMPWGAVMLSQMGSYAADWIPPVTLAGAVTPYTMMIWPLSIHETAGTWAGMTLLTLGVIVMASARALRVGQWGIVWLAFAPAVAAIAISMLWRPMYLWRALIGCAPFVYLLIGMMGNTQVRFRLATTALAPALILGVTMYYSTIVDTKTGPVDMANVARRIETGWRDGDVIYHVNSGTMMAMFPYTRNQHSYLMPQPQRVVGSMTPGSRSAMGMIEVPLSSLRYRRAWLVWAAGQLSPSAEDDTVDALVRLHPSQLIVRYSDDYSDAAVWLLLNAERALRRRARYGD